MSTISIIWTASYALVVGSVLLAFAGLLVFSESRRQDAVFIDLYWKAAIIFLVALGLSFIARIPEKKQAMDTPSGFKRFWIFPIAAILIFIAPVFYPVIK